MSSEIKVAFSSINVAQTPHALRSAEWLGDFAAGAHCDAVEYMPQFDLLPGHTARAIARAVRTGGLPLNSLHASFREGPQSANANRLPDGSTSEQSLVGRVLGSPLGRLVVPEMCESAAVIGRIQQQAGVKLPVTLYPQRSFLQDEQQINAAQGSSHLFQPTDHVARLMATPTLEDFNTAMHDRRGYGYVLDTYHARRRYGRGEPGLISDTATSVPAMARHITALHLSLNRFDIPGESHIPTFTEAQDALTGKYHGELRDMLDTVKDVGEVDYVVIEATLGAVAMASEHGRLADVQKDYADIADGFRQYWQS